MSEFLILKSAEEARAILADFLPVGKEVVGLAEAGGRVLAADVTAPEDVPAFPRATMDGYAVRARDLYGASEGAPAYLKVAYQVAMGARPERPLAPGEAAAISTGGMLPDGADAVVMVEWTQPVRPGEIEALRPVAPGENVIRPGEDVPRGRHVLREGQRLRPQDVGLCAALGLPRVPVFARPRVHILSTGNELVAPADVPAPGQVRDVNQYALAAAAGRAGAVATLSGVIADEPGQLRAAVGAAAQRADLTLLSGGSSLGVRDLTAEVLGAFGDILFHGISVRPGKPTILARSRRGAPLVGMPGPPLSALVIFDVFIRPLLARLGGETAYQSFPARV
ncbi:MAG TPA: gephyrin-like molybdotransferase Glp, partial [Polyangia bacterium]|nr:gephyrin-like molybdotransferase Glp [Polyangia bacterium]